MNTTPQIQPPQPIFRNHYSCVYADCPWVYDHMRSVKNGGFTYPPMTMEDLLSLPVATLAAKHCVLLLWATMPKLGEALDTIRAWGFTYTTCAFAWIKLGKGKGVFVEGNRWILEGGPRVGTGHWTNGNIELCLLGKRGNPRRHKTTVRQVVLAPITRHSEKPFLYDRIQDLLGDGPKLELFARPNEERLRWKQWTATGFDLDGRDIRTLFNQEKDEHP